MVELITEWGLNVNNRVSPDYHLHSVISSIIEDVWPWVISNKEVDRPLWVE